MPHHTHLAAGRAQSGPRRTAGWPTQPPLTRPGDAARDRRLGLPGTRDDMSIIVLTEKAPGPAVARVGDLIEVHLVENAGTDHLWQVVGIPRGLTVRASEAVPVGHRLPGAAQLRVLTFAANAAGVGRLSVALRRPREPAPLRTASWQVQVVR